MLSTTASSISNSNSVISESASSIRDLKYEKNNNLNQYVRDKRRQMNDSSDNMQRPPERHAQRYRSSKKEGSIDSNSSYSNGFGRVEKSKRIRELNNSQLNNGNKNKSVNRRDMINVNNVSNGSNGVNKKRYQAKIYDSSELSSNNNFSMSEIDSNSSNVQFPNLRLQRKRLIKCILREDIDLLVSIEISIEIRTISQKIHNLITIINA
jgi:hypothetical protein